MRQKNKPLARKPAVIPGANPGDTRKRRNAWEPQVIVPHQIDLPLNQPGSHEVVVPAAPNGRSLVNGRL
ncbi:MAG: hypothetical protein ACT6U0_07590 [Shinella sp.]|uniref:hypothetical protein n=1 Tax=Shinella sp. TaxID=1870904 RepID=UPI004037016B